MNRPLDRLNASYHFPPQDRQRLLTPALLIFMDHVEANIRQVVQYAGGNPDRWRPHIKTAKIPQVLARLGAHRIRHYKCATTREADVLLATLATAGRNDVDLLVAYPHIGPALGRLAEIARAHPTAKLSVLCEDPEAAAEIPPELSIFVDVNPGMNRTGAPAVERARILEIARRAGVRFRGIHSYEGHITHGSLDERRQQAFRIYDQLMGLITGLPEWKSGVSELVTSGTPAFLQALAYPPFTEQASICHRVSPGTVVYHDTRSVEDVPELELTPAALVLTRVISHPTEDLITCDAGSKSIAAEAGDPCAVVAGCPHLLAQKPSEEHLPVQVLNGPRPARGELLLLIPRHVCPTVNLADSAVIVEGGRIAGITPVSARGHETILVPPF